MSIDCTIVRADETLRFEGPLHRDSIAALWPRIPDDLRGEVALVPASKGEFRILVDGVLVWDRVADEGFPEAKEIKQRVRDVIAPERDLGHADRKPAAE